MNSLVLDLVGLFIHPSQSLAQPRALAGSAPSERRRSLTPKTSQRPCSRQYNRYQLEDIQTHPLPQEQGR
jgi:hypothetical protein